MDDRANFLATLAADPADDVTRLAFADWLDENTASDRDAATAEFIRISCGAISSGEPYPDPAVAEKVGPWDDTPPPPAVARWLDAHASRLVPTLVAAGYRLEHRIGHRINATARLHDYSRISTGDVSLRFARGFVEGAWSTHDIAPLYQVARDQPLATLFLDALIWRENPPGSDCSGGEVYAPQSDMPLVVWNAIEGHDFVGEVDRYWRPFATDVPHPLDMQPAKFFSNLASPHPGDRAEAALSAAIRRVALALE